MLLYDWTWWGHLTNQKEGCAEGCAEGCVEGARRGARRGAFEAFRHILSCYTYYSWLIVLDLQRFITVCP